MPTRFRPHHPDQSLLLPPDLRDWLPEGHLAHHMSDRVDGLGLTAFFAPYEGDGRRKSPYEPRMTLKVFCYGHATGVVSSRGMARKLEEDVAFRVLGRRPGMQTSAICPSTGRRCVRTPPSVRPLATSLGNGAGTCRSAPYRIGPDGPGECPARPVRCRCRPSCGTCRCGGCRLRVRAQGVHKSSLRDSTTVDWSTAEVGQFWTPIGSIFNANDIPAASTTNIN